jgi:hypothetical protein
VWKYLCKWFKKICILKREKFDTGNIGFSETALTIFERLWKADFYKKHMFLRKLLNKFTLVFCFHKVKYLDVFIIKLSEIFNDHFCFQWNRLTQVQINSSVYKFGNNCLTIDYKYSIVIIFSKCPLLSVDLVF